MQMTQWLSIMTHLEFNVEVFYPLKLTFASSVSASYDRRWTIIKSTMGKRLVFAEIILNVHVVHTVRMRW